MSSKTIDTDLLLEYGINTYGRVIYAVGEVNEALYTRILYGIEILTALDIGPINILLSSTGGDVDYGLAIYDLIRASSNPIDICVNGPCLSAATLILCAARKRSATQSSSFLIHHGSTSADSDAEKKHDEKVHRYWVNCVAERVNVQKSTVYDWHRVEKWFTAQEALKVNLIDQIGEPHENK